MRELLTCIMCPLGCELEVTQFGGDLQIDGNKCEKGVEFAQEEILNPKRNLATSVPILGQSFKMLSVRLSERVPRKLLFDILKEISQLKPIPPVKCGEILIENVFNTGVNVIATRTVR